MIQIGHQFSHELYHFLWKISAIMEIILDCSRGTFPLTYLRLPLSSKSPRRRYWLPLIEKIERKLDGWEGNNLSLEQPY